MRVYCLEGDDRRNSKRDHCQEKNCEYDQADIKQLGELNASIAFI